MHCSLQLCQGNAHRLAYFRVAIVGRITQRAKGLSVARMMAHITYQSEAGMDQKFGRRYQFGEDAQRGRIYLPQDELERFGVSVPDILAAKYSDNFRALMEFQIERAEHYYEQAMSHLPAGDRKSQRPGLVMAAIYRTTLDEIKRDGCTVLTQRTSLPALRKLWIAWRTWIKG